MAISDETNLELKRRIKELEAIITLRFTTVPKGNLLIIQGKPLVKDIHNFDMLGEKTGVHYIVCDNLELTFSYLSNDMLRMLGLKRIGVDGGTDLH